MADDPHLNREKWKQAIHIILKYEDLPFAEIKAKIKNATMDPETLELANRLLNRIEQKDLSIDDINKNIFIEPIVKNDFLIGKKIESFEVVKLIAKGGMSSIYQAVNANDKSKIKVAIKILSPYVFSEKSIELFKREHMILSKLNHPNIISIHQSGLTNDGVHYLVMDYVKDAQTIEGYCKTNHLSVSQIVELVIQIARVFAYTHKNLIIHRDIKASNVLITEEQQIKIIDFGIGRIQSNKNQTVTHVFTPETASPEQILGNHVGIQTDVFSLGALLLQLLSNKKPLPKINLNNYDPRNDEKNIKELLQTLSFDSDLKNIIFRAMHIDMDQRYENMVQFGGDLVAWSKHLPVSATTDTKSYRIKKFMARNPISSLLSMLLLLLTVISVAFILNFAQTAKKESIRSTKVMNYMMQLFSHLDPITAKDGNITLKEVLKKANNNFLEAFKGDTDAQIFLYSKLGEINKNLELNQEALKQYEIVLQLLNSKNDFNPQFKLSIKNAKAFVLNQLGNTDASIKLSNEVLSNYEEQKLIELPIKIMALVNLLHATRKFYGFEIYDKYNFNKIKTQLESIYTAQNDLNDSQKIKIVHALGQAYLSQKKYTVAIDYFNHEFEILNNAGRKNNAVYIRLLLDLTAAQIQNKELGKAEDVVREAIALLNELDNGNIRLGWAYQLYAQIYEELGQYTESIDMLNQALQIAELNKNDYQTYHNYFIRASYHDRNSQYHPGLSAQLSLFPFIIETTGINSPRMAVNLMNLAMMLHTFNEIDLGQKAAQLSIDIWFLLDKPSQRHSFLTLAGNLAVTSGNKDLAKTYLNEAKSIGSFNEKISTKVLSHLLYKTHLINIYPNEIYKYPHNNKYFYLKLYALLQSNHGISGITYNPEILMSLCQINLSYRKMRIVAFKELFLNQCMQAYENQGLFVPTEISEQMQLIVEGKQLAQSIFNDDMRKEVIAIIKSVEVKLNEIKVPIN